MGDAISHSAESMAHGIHKRKGSKGQRHRDYPGGMDVVFHMNKKGVRP